MKLTEEEIVRQIRGYVERIIEDGFRVKGIRIVRKMKILLITEDFEEN